MKFGIKAKEIMEDDFPIIDSNLEIEKCITNLNKKHEAAVIVKKGNFVNIISYNDLIEGFLKRKGHEKVGDLKIKRRFRIVNEDSDVYELLKFMKRGRTDFLLVKNKKNIIGLITKNDIIKIEPFLLETLLFQR